MQSVCPICEKLREINIVKKNETSTIRGQTVTAEAEYSICNSCGQEFATADQMERTLRNAYNEYRKIENILFPKEIIVIRKKYGASQKAFAKILDLGELTINSYEQGSLPVKSVSNLIKLMNHPENFGELYEKNKHKLSSHQRRKIESILSGQKVHSYQVDLDDMIEVKEAYTGYNRPDWEKYIVLLQLILYHAKKKLYKMVMLKIAFYADFTAFKRNVRSLTGWPYAALPYGPVPDKWKEILRLGEENGNFISEPDESEMGDLYFLPEDFYILKIETVFSPGEIEIIQEVTQRLKDKSATELRDLTHSEDAWKKTKKASCIEYRLAETLKLF